MNQDKIWDYYQNNSDYDSFGGSLPRYRYLAKQVGPGQKVLNIGVGRGGLEKLLIEKKVEVSSLDPSEVSIEKLRNLGMGDSARVGYSQNICFADHTFDVVIMSEVLEHLDDESLLETLKEVRRVLRVGGSFIGTVPARENLVDNEAVCPGCGERFHRWGHVQTFSPQSLTQLFLEHDYKIVLTKVTSFPDWRRPGLVNFAKSFFRWILGLVGQQVAVPSIYFSVTRDY